MNIGVLAYPALRSVVTNVLGRQTDPVLVLPAANAREALDYAYAPNDVLILEDHMLEENPGMLQRAALLPCHKILVGQPNDLGCARRAVMLGASEVVDALSLVEGLPSALAPFRVAENPKQPGIVIGVFSVKGGVGKSTVALNLAWSIAKVSNHEVALVDLDPYGDIASMIAEPPPVDLVALAQGLAEGMDPRKTLESLSRPAPNLTVVPAASNPQASEFIRPEHVGQVIRFFQSTHAYVVLDIANGLHDQNLAALDAVTQILLVALPEVVTLRSVRQSLTVLSRLYADKVTVVLNRVNPAVGLSREEVATELGRTVDHVFPDGGVAPVKASNTGLPLVVADPRNPLAKALRGYAAEFVVAREGALRRSRWNALHSASIP